MIDKLLSLANVAGQNGAIILSRNGYSSSSYYYGIVRVYYNNGWGNICDDYYYNSAELMSSVINWDILEPLVILELD